MLTQQQIESIEKSIDYKFANQQFLQTAFTHSSYAYAKKIESNERLEFLGDSVLNFCTTLFLYNNFQLSEGESSKTRAYIVSSENVSKFIVKNQLENFLLCDHFNPHKSVNVMGDLYEAIVGAIFKDSNLENCKKFIYESLSLSNQTIEKIIADKKDYKTQLQEFVQANGGKLQYVLLCKSGPAHMPEFTVQVLIDNVPMTTATALSKKEAENICAKQTLQKLI